MPKLTIVVPCWKRPARTRRIINNILAQDCNDWEAFIIGDGCTQFQSLIVSGEADFYTNIANMSGNQMHIFNLDKNYGGYGHHAINLAIERATGEFFIFAGNDDRLHHTHFNHYLSEIAETTLDMVYYKTWCEPYSEKRYPELKKSKIGHSEVIIRTSKLKGLKQPPSYTGDWELIKQLLDKTSAVAEAKSQKTTYFITSIQNKTFDIID